MDTPHMNDRDILREFFKQWPRFYYLIAYIFGPAYFGYMSPHQFLKKYFPSQQTTQRILNLGSGPKKIREGITNVDIEKYEGVDVVADLTDLPFQDGEISGLICDTVLEHTINPIQSVSEMNRVLKNGGVAYISVPFLYPFHASPSDYTRWTEQGLRVLVKDFEIVEIGSRSSMFSVLNTWLCYLIPNLFSFGSTRFYWFLVNISLFCFFPIKFLDFIANRLPFATQVSSVLYCVIRKKVSDNQSRVF